MKKKVLIVDDASFMRGILRDFFIKLGFKIVGEASNGIDAYEKYKALAPDLVTMDITMPHMSGIESVKKIIAFDDDANIIIVSATGQKNTVLDSIRAGAKNFILKPVSMEKLVKAIDETIDYDN